LNTPYAYAVPEAGIDNLWDAFNDVAEGFGLTVEEFLEIVRVSLKEFTEMTDKRLDLASQKVFAVFDDDVNGLIDALEFLGAFAVLSGMSHEQKINFVFSIYDFDESGELSVDEMALALKSTITGLTKLSGVTVPLEADLENIALQAFLGADEDGDQLISRDEFLLYCKNTPEVVSWIEFYSGQKSPYNDLVKGTKLEDDGTVMEGLVPFRTENHTAAMDPDAGVRTQLEIEARGWGEDVAPQQPWKNIVVYCEPSNVDKPSYDAPNASLDLQWVHGYHAGSCRNNLKYNKQGEIVFHGGCVGVTFNPVEYTQRFNQDHVDEISCLAINLDYKVNGVVATGENGKVPHINIWDPFTMELLTSVRGFHSEGVSHVDFSPDGTHIVSVGRDTWHSVLVYNWETRQKMFSSVSTKEKILDAKFVLDERTFVTCGVQHIHFWSRISSDVEKQSYSYSRDEGVFSFGARMQTITCIEVLGAYIITGTLSGQLYVWAGKNSKRAVNAHSVKHIYCAACV
jgi:microtubule-associated protein-like 6